jgi:hypothetical protein
MIVEICPINIDGLVAVRQTTPQWSEALVHNVKQVISAKSRALLAVELYSGTIELFDTKVSTRTLCIRLGQSRSACNNHQSLMMLSVMVLAIPDKYNQVFDRCRNRSIGSDNSMLLWHGVCNDIATDAPDGV